MRIAFILLFFVLGAGDLLAQGPPAMMVPPHAQQGVQTGLIEGEVFYRDPDKKPLVGEKVVLLVKRGEEQVLILSKQTDQSGRFQFKNIFKDPLFSYSFAVIFNEQLYVIPHLSLPPGEDKKFLSFEVGPTSPYAVESPPPESMAPSPDGMVAMPPPSSLVAPSFTVSRWESRTPQRIGLALAILVVIVALHFSLRRKPS